MQEAGWTPGLGFINDYKLVQESLVCDKVLVMVFCCFDLHTLRSQIYIGILNTDIEFCEVFIGRNRQPTYKN